MKLVYDCWLNEMFLNIAATANGRILAVFGKIVIFSVAADLIALKRGGGLIKLKNRLEWTFHFHIY